MQKAMSRQAEAERERRAKIIAADGEFQASEKLSQAANVISREPGDAAAALPADAGRDRRQQQLDDRLPACRSTCSSRCSSRMRHRACRRRADLRRCRRVATPRTCLRCRTCRRARPELPTGNSHRAAHRAEDGPRPGPGRAAGRVRSAAGEGARGRSGEMPVLRGPRGPHAARGLGASAGGGAPDTPGWTARSVPNLYPVLGADRGPGAELRAAGQAMSPLGSRLDRSARRLGARLDRAVSLAAGDSAPTRSSSAPPSMRSRSPSFPMSASPARSTLGASGCAHTPTPPICT